jgi:hypothetical protein
MHPNSHCDLKEMNMKRVFTATLLATAIAACGGGGGSDSSPSVPGTQQSFTGVWEAAAYGKVMQYDGTTLKWFDYSSDYCLLNQQFNDVSSDDLRDSGMQLADGGQTLQSIEQLHGLTLKGEAYKRKDDLPASCSNNLVAAVNAPGYSRSPSRDFEMLYQTYDEYYLDFSQRNVDWAERRTAVENRITDAMSDEAFFLVLAEMLEPLGDSHVKLLWSNQGLASFNGRPTIQDKLSSEWQMINGPVDNEANAQAYQQFIEGEIARVQSIRNDYAQTAIGTAANGLVSWYVGAGNIGVLMIDGMLGFSGQVNLDDIDKDAELGALEAALDAAMSALANTEALILDLRLNGGGLDIASQMVARRFMDTERHVFSRQSRQGDSRTPLQEITLAPHSTTYLKPLAVLTSATTTSAGEVLTLMLRSLPQVTLIGEATQGALSDVLRKKLPNGFEYWMSNEYILSADGEWFEATGIPVTQDVEFATPEQRANEEDLGLEAAYQFLITQ